MIRNQTKKRQSGFSLLEVLLALSLSVVVIGAIGSAVHLHLITLARQQAEIESKQVARSVIMMISNDISAGIQYRAQDFSSLENLALSEQMIAGIFSAMSDDANEGNDAAGAAGAAAGAGALADGAGAGADGGGAPSEDGVPVDTEEMDPEDCVSCRPTFIGTATAISVDASRLPRLDEYNPILNSENEQPIQTPSDVKSIAFFVTDTPPADDQLSQFRDVSNHAPGGLYRRQIDRAIAAFRGEDGTPQIDQYAKLVAPEVAEIQLRYFNSEDWVTEWDSEEDGGFPTAVEVVVVIDPARMREGSDYSYGGFDPETMEIARNVIHLPGAELEETEE